MAMTLRTFALASFAAIGHCVVEKHNFQQSVAVLPQGIDTLSDSQAISARGQVFLQQSKTTKVTLSAAENRSQDHHKALANESSTLAPSAANIQADKSDKLGDVQTPSIVVTDPNGQKRVVHDGQQPAMDFQAVQQGSYWSRILMQIIFGVIYYFAIVVKYPVMQDNHARQILEGGANEGERKAYEASKKIQDENAISATFQASFPNCLLSVCCSGPRAAHTFHATGILNFWGSLLAMTFFPCCTLWFTNSFSDLNKQLGGERKECCSGCLCAFFCSCCVIAQDAESLDAALEVRTEFCGISKRNDAFDAA